MMSIYVTHEIIEIGEKHYFINILRILIPIICNIKNDLIICEPDCVKLFIFMNLLHTDDV